MIKFDFWYLKDKLSYTVNKIRSYSNKSQL